jgi:hypothetical protein
MRVDARGFKEDSSDDSTDSSKRVLGRRSPLSADLPEIPFGPEGSEL